MTIDGFTIDDFRKLSEAFNAGKRYLVIAAGDVQLVESRAEAAKLVEAGPSIAFSLKELVSGNYEEPAAPEKKAAYRQVGVPT